MGLGSRGYKGIMGFGLVLVIWKEFKAEGFCFELNAVRKQGKFSYKRKRMTKAKAVIGEEIAVTHTGQVRGSLVIFVVWVVFVAWIMPVFLLVFRHDYRVLLFSS